MALWIASSLNSAYIVQGSGLISAATIKSNDCLYVLSIPIEFHNSGNTAVTFRRFVPSEIPSVIFGKNKKLLNSPKNDFELYLSNESIDYNNLPRWLKRVQASQIIDLSSYQFSDQLVPPKSSFKKYLVLITKPYKDNDNIADRIYFSIFSEFGNEQKLPFNFLTDVESYINTSCIS